MSDPTVEARRCALLVLDAQSAFVAGLPDPDEFLAKARAAVDLARSAGAHVGFVRMGFTPADFAAIPPESSIAMLVTPEREAFLAHDTEATQIHEELAPAPEDIVVRKTRVGSFTTTDLDRRLRDRGVSTVILAGLATSGAVLAAALEALERDYRTVVLLDACADPDPAAHDFVLETIVPRHAIALKVEDLEGVLRA